MAGEPPRRGGLEMTEGGPGAAYHQNFGVSEHVMEMLKLLDYEEKFCKQFNFKPLSRHYFAVPKNAAEQFHCFASLFSWLVSHLGRHFEAPQEYDDDPNSTLSQIIDELKQMGFESDFPRSKLRQGSGEHVLTVLHSLCDKVLEASRFQWKRPVFDDDDDEEEEVIGEETAELTIKDVEDEIVDETDQQETFLDLEGLKEVSLRTLDSGKPENVLESQQDAAEWRLEVERVLPMLKVHIRTDNKDWRSHIEQMHQHQSDIESAMVETKSQLDKLHTEVTRTLEKIASREKYINQQLEGQIEEYRNLQDKLAEVQQRYKNSSGSVNDLTRDLSQITDALETVKAQMDERGTSMTDSGPVVKLKQGLQRLKAENIQMELQVGVLEHVLMSGMVRDRSAMQQDMKASDAREHYEKFDAF
jgi:estrogen-related receptor beta like 1